MESNRDLKLLTDVILLLLLLLSAHTADAQMCAAFWVEWDGFSMNGPEWLGMGESGLESAGIGSGSQWECRGRGRSGYGFMAGAAVECDRRVGKAAGAPLCWRVWRELSSYTTVSNSSSFLSLPEDCEFSCPQATFDLLVICLFFFYVVVMLWLVTVIKVVALFVECLTLPAVWRSSYRGTKESLPKLCSEQQSLWLCS